MIVCFEEGSNGGFHSLLIARLFFGKRGSSFRKKNVKKLIVNSSETSQKLIVGSEDLGFIVFWIVMFLKMNEPV